MEIFDSGISSRTYDLRSCSRDEIPYRRVFVPTSVLVVCSDIRRDVSHLMSRDNVGSYNREMFSCLRRSKWTQPINIAASFNPMHLVSQVNVVMSARGCREASYGTRFDLYEGQSLRR